MENNRNTAEYTSFNKITDPETLKILKRFANDPLMPSGKDLMYDLYQRMGIDVDYDEIFAEE